MISPISNIIRKTVRKENEPLNILCAPTHEAWETILCKTGHNFYAWRVLDGSIKDWDSTYRPLPKNYHLLNPHLGSAQIPTWIDLDLVFSQNKFGQFQSLVQIANYYSLPLISHEHTQPLPQWSDDYLRLIKSMKGNYNVFISEFSRNAWGWSENEGMVIHHGIDTDLFKPLDIPKKKHICSVVNDFINRDMFCGYNVWRKVTEGLPVYPVGKTPGLSLPAKDVNELIRFYNESQIFINTSLVSPIPMSTLEAMSCGAAVVSTATAMLPEIISNGHNGYITNDLDQMRKYLEELLENPDLCKTMGHNARETIKKNFSQEKFVENWNKLFYKAANL